jgi:hypothetical protein
MLMDLVNKKHIIIKLFIIKKVNKYIQNVYLMKNGKEVIHVM